MEADKSLSADIRKARSGNNTIAISQASISLSTSLTEPCLYEKAGGEFSLHQSNFTSDGQHLEVPRVTSGGSRRRECPLPKKLPPFLLRRGCGGQVGLVIHSACAADDIFRGPSLHSSVRLLRTCHSAKKPTRSPIGTVRDSCISLPVSISRAPPGGALARALGSGTLPPGRVPRAKRLGRSGRSEIP